MKLVLHVVTMVVCSIFRIDFSLTQEILCTLRSPIGDVIYNTSSDAQCGRDGNHTGVDFLTCPEEEQTFLSGSHCCIQDQLLLNECGLQLIAEGSNMSLSTIPVVLTSNATNRLMIIDENITNLAMIYDTNSSDIVTNCTGVKEITTITGSWSRKLSEEHFTVDIEGTIRVSSMDLNYTESGVYKLHLQCNTTRSGRSEQEQCLFFKLITSQNQFAINITELNSLNESTIPLCTNISTPITSETITDTTQSQTTEDTTVENPSIWEMYNKLLVYVVVGAGCALGLLLIFIVMLCLFTGCIVNKRRRYSIHRKHQLETATGQGHMANPQRRPHVECERNTSYIFQTPNTPEDILDGGVIEDTSLTAHNTASSQTHPQLVKVEVPVVPQIHLQQTDNIDNITFDSFKRLSPKKTEMKEPTRDEPSAPVAANLQAYYETVTPVRPSDQNQDPMEAYDTLIHKGGPQPLTKTRHFTIPAVDSQYSHLNTNTAKISPSPLTVNNSFEPGRSYSLVTPQGRKNNCISPPPLPPPLALYDGVELLNPNDFSNKDIFTSSWSQPSMIDKFKPGYSEIQEVYDHPTSLDLVPPKPLKHRDAGVTEDEGENIEYPVEEPIYDVPPPQSPEHDLSSLDSYVDMQGHSIHNKFGETL